MSQRKSPGAGGRLRGVFVLVLEDHELVSPGVRVNLTLGWLTKYATVAGEGVVDQMILSDGVTAYFDSQGASKAPVSCLLFPEGEAPKAVAGPVVFACWNARRASEATVLVADRVSLAAPVPTVEMLPYIHPTWPTIQ